MSVKLEGHRKRYHPKDDDKVECHVHGIVTTWGALDSIQQLAVEEGLDTAEECPCLLAPKTPLPDHQLAIASPENGSSPQI